MSASQQLQLKWKGPPVPRAKPIAPEKWEEHRVELGALYQQMTLEDLMAVMKIRHSFVPSRRQYIFQFEKWSFKKHEANPMEEEPRPVENRAVLSHPPLHTKSQEMSQGSGSWHTSIYPAQPPKRPQSLRDKPPVPPKKRQKLAVFLSQKELYADLGLAFDVPQTPVPSPQDFIPDAKQDSSLRGMTRSFVNQTAPGSSVFSIQHRENYCDFSSEISCGSMLSENTTRSSGSGLLDLEQYIDPLQGDKIHPQKIQVDSSRPVDTISPDEIDKIKCAADFLKSLHCEEDAFALYILIFKRLKDIPDQPAWKKTSAIISCALTAATPSQAEIVCSLLRQSLDEIQGSLTDVERFVFLMLLAEIHLRSNDFDTAKYHLEIAVCAELGREELVTHLPGDNCTPDIITYHYLTGGLTNRLTKDLSTERPPWVDCVKVQQMLLYKDPGPFEIKEDLMKNPCLRSCLQWCVWQLGSAPSLLISWEEVKRKRKKNAFAAEAVAIYCCLWDHSQSSTADCCNAACLLWIDQAERLMGISAAQLLRTVCSMVMSAAFKGKDKSERQLVLRAYKGAVFLSQRPDEVLGCEFLNRSSYLEGLATVKPGKLWDSQCITTAYAKELIQKKLWIRLLDVLMEALQASSPRQSIEIVAAAFLPTLASSMHSSELASLRMIRDRMQRNARDAMQGVAMTLPSSILRASSQSIRSFPTISMSELSQAMASSLSLSSLQQAGSSAMDALATVSSNARSKIRELEGEWDQARQISSH